MGGLFVDHHIVLTRGKAYLDFHTPGWKSMIVDVSLRRERQEMVSAGICMKCIVNSNDATVRGVRGSLTPS